jgi:hypothetical protein
LRIETFQVLSGIEVEIASLHDLLQATSSTVGASTAATVQLQQLHQVEVHRLQSEIEAQRSKGTHLAIELAAIQSHLAEISAKHQDEILQLQQDLDRVSLAEAAAKQSLSRDRCSCRASLPPPPPPFFPVSRIRNYFYIY